MNETAYLPEGAPSVLKNKHFPPVISPVKKDVFVNKSIKQEIKLPDIPQDQLGKSLQSQNNNNNRFSNIRQSGADIVDDLKSEERDMVEEISPNKKGDEQSFNEKELDGLLNWAKALPEEDFQASGSSFFK